MKFGGTAKGAMGLDKALKSQCPKQLLLHSVGFLHTFADDLDVLMSLGFELPGPLDAIGRQAALFWFLKSLIALVLAIEELRDAQDCSSDKLLEKQINVVKYICEVLHATNDLGWQSRDRISFLAATLSASISLRG